MGTPTRRGSSPTPRPGAGEPRRLDSPSVNDAPHAPHIPAAALRLSRGAAVLRSAVILPQGRRLRRDTPRLPDAPAPWHGTVGEGEGEGEGERTLHLLVLGDSTAAGVGVEHAELGLGGRLAEAIADRTGRTVDWRAHGRNGATARDLVRGYLAAALERPVDILFLTVGANDALALRSSRAFRRDVRHIVRATRAQHPAAVVLMSSLPAFFRFRLLPEPLRGSLYRHSRALEAAARMVVDAEPEARMSPPPPPYTDGFFASDEFHPSALGYRDWAEFAVDDAAHAGLLARWGRP